VKIFPVCDSILLPLTPTIAGTIADYLQLMTQAFRRHLSRNCDDVGARLSPDLTWQLQVTKSMKLVPTSPYQYVSTIAHRLAAKSLLTPLEICKQLQSPTLSPQIDSDFSLDLSCWYNDAGYIYFQIAPMAIALWLEYIQNLPLAVTRIEQRASSATIAIYAHARCCSVLTLAATAEIVQVSANWEIIPPSLPWRSDPERCSYLVNRGITEWTSIFEHPAEQRLVHALMVVLDAISIHHFQAAALRQRGGDEGKTIEPMGSMGISNLAGEIRPPNWHKLTLDLAQSWLDFYRDCRIFGDVQRQHPHLAIARCGLTAIVRRYLQVLLEHQLGVVAAIEL
jgi:hypothetical protein